MIKKINILKKAIKTIFANNKDLDENLEWDEDWHEDVIKELSMERDGLLDQADYVDIYDDENKLMRLKLIDVGDDLYFAGSGAYSKVLFVDYNGKESVLKIISGDDNTIDVYGELLSIQNELPNDWSKYIPKIYFMRKNINFKFDVSPDFYGKERDLNFINEYMDEGYIDDNISHYDYETGEKISDKFDIVIMERLKSLSTVENLIKSFGSIENLELGSIDIISDVVKNYSIKNIDYLSDDKKFYNKNLFVKIYSKLILPDNLNEFVKTHVDKKINDRKYLKNCFIWIFENIKLNIEISFENIAENKSAEIIKTIYAENLIDLIWDDNSTLDLPISIIKIAVNPDYVSNIKNLLISKINTNANPVIIENNIVENIIEIIKQKQSIIFKFLDSICDSYELLFQNSNKTFPIDSDNYYLEKIDKSDLNIEVQNFYEFLVFLMEKYKIQWYDLHTKNIMIGSDMEYKLSDVGLFEILK